jgi:hypothetical protein
MRSFVVLLLDARRPDHAADVAISVDCRRKDTQKALNIEAPLVTRMLVCSTT